MKTLAEGLEIGEVALSSNSLDTAIASRPVFVTVKAAKGATAAAAGTPKQLARGLDVDRRMVHLQVMPNASPARQPRCRRSGAPERRSQKPRAIEQA